MRLDFSPGRLPYNLHLRALILIGVLAGLSITYAERRAYAQFIILQDSYITRFTIEPNEQTKGLRINLTYCKTRHPDIIETEECQCYLIATQPQNFSEIEKLSFDRSIATKTPHEPKFLEELIEKKLAVVLGTLAARSGPEKPEETEFKKFEFNFKLEYDKIFNLLETLDGKPIQKEFEIVVFIPVRDCKYSNLISRNAMQGNNDVGMVRGGFVAPFGLDEKTIFLYFKRQALTLVPASPNYFHVR